MHIANTQLLSPTIREYMFSHSWTCSLAPCIGTHTWPIHKYKELRNNFASDDNRPHEDHVPSMYISLADFFSPSIWLQTCSINKRGGPEAPAKAPEVPGRAPDAQEELQMLREEVNRHQKMLILTRTNDILLRKSCSH